MFYSGSANQANKLRSRTKRGEYVGDGVGDGCAAVGAGVGELPEDEDPDDADVGDGVGDSPPPRRTALSTGQTTTKKGHEHTFRSRTVRKS